MPTFGQIGDPVTPLPENENLLTERLLRAEKVAGDLAWYLASGGVPITDRHWRIWTADVAAWQEMIQ